MAQIHAFLYLSEEPQNAEQIAAHLALARSNVSTSLRELQAWGVVRIVHKLGNRRDYFEAVSDVWHMFLTILEQRKRREVDPTLAMLRECVAELETTPGRSSFPLERMHDLLETLELLSNWYEQMRHLSPASQRHLLKLGNKLSKVLGEVRPIGKGPAS